MGEDIDRIAVTADTYLTTMVDMDLVMAATSITTADIGGTSRITVDISLDMVNINRISVAMEGINLTMVTEDSDHIMAAVMGDTDIIWGTDTEVPMEDTEVLSLWPDMAMNTKMKKKIKPTKTPKDIRFLNLTTDMLIITSTKFMTIQTPKTIIKLIT